MTTAKRDPILRFLRCSDSKDKDTLAEALENIQTISSTEGLSDAELEDLVGVLTSSKTTSFVAVKLLHCLVPEKVVSSKALQDLLSWYFTSIETQKISKATGKQFIHWLTGVVHFELGDVNVIDSYFHSFLFLLRFQHLESIVSKLICLLLKPEDAKRWIIKKILEIQNKSGSKAHTNSILSILKSYRPDIVPESVPLSRINYDNSAYTEYFRAAHERRIHSSGYVPSSTIEISWNRNNRYNKKSAQLPRLIPTPEFIDFEPSTRLRVEKFSLVETRTMRSLGTHCFRIEIPSQTLSLLTNVAGFHVLTFSDPLTKVRFSHKLRYTLIRVFVTELEPYSKEEKTMFLDSLIGLQEYMQEGIPAVTEFLLHYLLMWDGVEFRDQILKMIQWIVLKNSIDWQDFLFRPIRQVFRQSGRHCKYMIIESMSSLLRNLITSVLRRGRTLFFDDSPVWNAGHTSKAIEELVNFVSDLVVEGILWNDRDGKRDVMTAALDFYDIYSTLEYSEEFPIVVALPPALVYGCLFSGSRVCVSRMCSLLLRLWTNTYEKLQTIRTADEFSVEIEKTTIYILDYYRCLWSNTDYEPMKDSFMFRDKAFDNIYWKFQECFAVNAKALFKVENNATFVGSVDSFRENRLENLSWEYPAIVKLKNFCESY